MVTCMDPSTDNFVLKGRLLTSSYTCMIFINALLLMATYYLTMHIRLYLQHIRIYKHWSNGHMRTYAIETRESVHIE